RHKFIPAILGDHELSDTEREMFALPARSGGLAIDNPAASSTNKYSDSVKATEVLTNLIISQEPSLATHRNKIATVKREIRNTIADRQEKEKNKVIATLPPD